MSPTIDTRGRDATLGGGTSGAGGAGAAGAVVVICD